MSVDIPLLTTAAVALLLLLLSLSLLLAQRRARADLRQTEQQLIELQRQQAAEVAELRHLHERNGELQQQLQRQVAALEQERALHADDLAVAPFQPGHAAEVEFQTGGGETQRAAPVRAARAPAHPGSRA